MVKHHAAGTAILLGLSLNEMFAVAMQQSGVSIVSFHVLTRLLRLMVVGCMMFSRDVIDTVKNTNTKQFSSLPTVNPAFKL